MANAYYDDPLQLLAKQRVQQYVHQAEMDHLASDVHPGRTSQWSRQIRQPFRFLGRALTGLGERLMTPERMPDTSKV